MKKMTAKVEEQTLALRKKMSDIRRSIEMTPMSPIQTIPETPAQFLKRKSDSVKYNIIIIGSNILSHSFPYQKLGLIIMIK